MREDASKELMGLSGKKEGLLDILLPTCTLQVASLSRKVIKDRCGLVARVHRENGGFSLDHSNMISLSHLQIKIWNSRSQLRISTADLTAINAGLE